MLRRTSLNLPNSLLSVIALAVAVAAAVALVALSQSGGVDMVVFVSVGIVATVAALHSNEFGLMAIIFVAAIDGFLKGISPGWHTQLLKDYILAICLLRWAWMSVMGHRRQSVKVPVSLPILVFIGWVCVQFLNTRSESVLISLAGLRMWVIWLPTFFLAYDTFDTREKVERLLLFLVALMIPMAIYGIIQHRIGLDHLLSLGPGFSSYTYSYYPGAETDQWRPPATMISTHALADTLTMVALMAVGLAVYHQRNRLLQIAVIASVPLMGVTMMITAVRSAAASAVLGVAALLLIRRRLDLAVLVAIVGGLAIYQVDALGGGDAVGRIQSIIENPSYTLGRIGNPWRSALRFTTENPLGGGIASGVGTGRTGFTQRTFDPRNQIPFIENEYGRALLELGVPGLFFFLWMLYAVMRSNVRAYKRLLMERDKWLLAGLFAACVSILARLLVGPALYGWPEGPIFWYFAAIANRLPVIETEELRRSRAPDAETRMTQLGNTTLPWARAEDER
ncbi:MAG: O-antigen ligase family protein [Armatimonadota bacterium]